MWHAQKDGNKVSKMNTVLEAYDGIVRNLQAEVERMKNDMESLRKTQAECEERNEKMAVELEDLKKFVQSQHTGDTPVVAVVTTERKKPGPKPGSKRAAKPAPKSKG